MQPRKLIPPAAALLSLAAVPTIGQAAAVVPNFQISGIPAAGFSHFDAFQDVTVTLLRNGSGAGATFNLTASYSAPGSVLFQYDPWTAFTVSGASFQLAASFDSSAHLLGGGTVTVTGSIPGYTVPGTTAPPAGNSLLYKANLLGFGADTVTDATPQALGFKTGGTDPTSWAYQFQGTGQESVYLYDFNVAALMAAFNPGNLSNPKYARLQFTRTSALATVPLPAAVWLFGTAMLALAGARRRAPGTE